MTKKIARRGKNIFPELSRYAYIINRVPDVKVVSVYHFNTKEQAEEKSAKLKGWTIKEVVQARNERGRYMKGAALICCK